MVLPSALKIFVTVLLLLAAPAAEVQSASGCLVSKYGSYAEAQEQWQRDLAGLVSEAAPAYGDVSRLFLQDQLNAIERNMLAVEYLDRERAGPAQDGSGIE